MDYPASCGHDFIVQYFRDGHIVHHCLVFPLYAVPWLMDSIVNYLIQDGKSNYLEGGLLIAVYLVLSHYMMMLTKDHCRRCMVLSEFGLTRSKK